MSGRCVGDAYIDPAVTTYCQGATETSPATCIDGLDNDCDGYVDCNDRNCCQPGAFMSTCPAGMFLDATVNAYCALRFLMYGLRGKGGSMEPVHPDHVAYYSFSTLKLLVERHKFDIDAFLFYDLGSEHRPYNRRIWNVANDLAVRLSPQLSDGIIIVCSNGDLPTTLI